jgi:hypothetical protein
MQNLFFLRPAREHCCDMMCGRGSSEFGDRGRIDRLNP